MERRETERLAVLEEYLHSVEIVSVDAFFLLRRRANARRRSRLL